MKVLRRMIGWFFIWLGALSLSVWASASFVTHKVDSGSVLSPILSTVLHQENIQTTITERAQSLFKDELTQSGIPISGTPEEQALDTAIANAVASEGFIDDLVDVIKEAESSIIAQLTDDTLPRVPLVITVNITEPLYSVIANTPEVSALVPPTALELITFDALDATEVGNIRDGYHWVQIVATWALWVGLGLLAAGVLFMPRRRWIIPKILLGLGTTVLVGWFIASKFQASSILDRLPDDTDPDLRKMVSDLIPQSRIDGIQSDLFKFAIILLSLAAMAYILVWFIFRKRKPRSEVEPEPEPELVLARTATAEAPVTVPDAAVPPPPMAVKPQGARSSGNQSAHFDGEDPVFSEEIGVEEESTDSGEPIVDHPEPGSPSPETGKAAGPTA